MVLNTTTIERARRFKIRKILGGEEEGKVRGEGEGEEGEGDRCPTAHEN